MNNDLNTLRDTKNAAALRAICLAAALLLMPPLIATAQDSASQASDDELFGAETVTEAKPQADAAPQNEFIKYDQVKVGGSIIGSAGIFAAWNPAWDGSADPFRATSYGIKPELKGKVTIVAKPLTDFGVNMDFRTAWPFTTTYPVLTGATLTGAGTTASPYAVSTTSTSISVPNISVWSLYSKFSWKDSAYFTFGKQPLSWGVAKSAFQPADDIFALSSAIDLTDTGAEREGPVSLKMTVPMSVTNNFYFYAGLPTATDGTTTVAPEEARLAVKAETGFGNTELAAGAFYAYNDHPRALLMGTTGTGDFNFFGEAVLKYGSERTFLVKRSATDPYRLVAPFKAQVRDSEFFFTGTAGGYYRNADEYLTIAAAYLYNGEGQAEANPSEAFTTYFSQKALPASETRYEIDRSKFGSHYGFVSLTKDQFLTEKLLVSVYAIANLGDLSGMVVPGITWTMFDYMSLKLSALFNFGAANTEYILYGPGTGLSLKNDKPGAAVNLTFTLGTGAF